MSPPPAGTRRDAGGVLASDSAADTGLADAAVKPSDAGKTTSVGDAGGPDLGSGDAGTDAGTTPPHPNCAFDDFAGHRYWFCDVVRERVDARALCMAIGGELVSIGSADEQAFIETHAGSGDFLIGAQRDAGSFAWYDGTPFAYEHWASLEPGLSDCVQLINGWWRTRSCSDAENWICEVP